MTKTYNPEKRTWRGKSYKAGGRPIADLKDRRGRMATHYSVGCLRLQRARSTGTIVGLYLADLANLDPDGGNYVTVCEEHGTLCNHETRKLAESSLPYPFNWCEECASKQK